MSVNTAWPMPSDEEDAAIRRATAADPDAYELSDAELARLVPARDILPRQLGSAAADALLRRRGRPAPGSGSGSGAGAGKKLRSIA